MKIVEFLEQSADEIAALSFVFSGITFLFLTHDVESSLAISGLGAVYLFGKRKGNNNE